MTINKAKTYSVKRVAEMLGLSRACVSRKCQNGIIPVIWEERDGIGTGCYRIPEASVEMLRRSKITPRRHVSAD